MPYVNLVVSRESNAALAQALAAGVTERTTRILRKSHDAAAVTVTFVHPAHWFVGARSLAELGVASFWLDCKVTLGTNTKDEKAAFLAEIWQLMQAELGPLHHESYALVHEAAPDAYGYGGLTQQERQQRASAAAE